MEHKDIKQEKTILVSIRCSVYNHEPYLRQCLDGFVMQKTNFAFEAIVHDDASTDKSADIIREYAAKYPDIIKPIYETENQYSKHDGSKRRIMNNAICQTAKYIAFCEGDDYWTDPLKLQKQFDFLETNTEYGLVYTKAIVFNHASNKYTSTIGEPYDNDITDILLKNPIPTLTVMIRKDILHKYYRETSEISKDWLMGDYPLWLYCSITSKIKFMDQTTAVYRVLAESVSHSCNPLKTLKFKISGLDIGLFFINKYFPKKNLDKKIKLYFYIKNMNLIIKYGDKNLKNEQYHFFLNNKLYGLLIINRLSTMFKKFPRLISLLYKTMIFCIKNNIIKSNI